MTGDTMPVAFSALDVEGPAWLGTARKAAREHFEAHGYPTRRSESWRYTDLKGFGKLTFDTPLADAGLAFTREILAPWLSPSAGNSAVFVNGVFSPRLSSFSAVAGLEVRSLAETLAIAPESVRPYLGHLHGSPDGGFVALNTAQFYDGALIRVGRGELVEAPVEVLFLTTEDEKPTRTETRVLVLAGEGSHVTVLERHLSLGSSPILKNTVTEVLPERDSVVRHVKVQQEGENAYHFGTTTATPAAGARFESTIISLGASVARNAVHVTLAEERATCNLTGVYAAAHSQSLDHYTHIDHAVPHCTSEQLYKGIVSDSAVGSYLGRILMRDGAVKSSTDQLSRTLLLGENARANAKPSLEIDNDDVRATHGAAIGQLDQNAIFYLRSRGIDLATARGLLIEGFVREVLDQVPVDGLGDSLIPDVLRRLDEVSA